MSKNFILFFVILSTQLDVTVYSLVDKICHKMNENLTEANSASNQNNGTHQLNGQNLKSSGVHGNAACSC